MMTEVTRKLSARSSYDIITPNTSLAIRGTKVLTQVLEDAVTGQIKSCNAILEGLVSIKGIKLRPDGTVIAIERELGPGEAVSFTTDKNELVSEEDMKSIADTGKTVDGVTVDTIPEEDGMSFETIADEQKNGNLRISLFDDAFLDNIKEILVKNAEEATGEAGLSDEDIAKIEQEFNDVMDAYIKIRGQLEGDTKASNDSTEVAEATTETTVNDPDALGTVAVDSESPATEDADSVELTETETDTVAETIEAGDEADNNDAGDAQSEDETKAEEAKTEETENTDSTDNRSDSTETSGSDSTQGESGTGSGDNGASTGDNVVENDATESGSGNTDKSEDNNSETGEEGAKDNTVNDGATDGEENTESNKTSGGQGTETGTGTGTSTGTGTGTSTGTGTGTGTSTSTPTSSAKPVSYTTQRVYSGQSGSSPAVGLVFYSGANAISASDLPQEFEVDEWLPGMGNSSTYSVLIEEQYRDAYMFTGWYTTQAAADSSDSAYKVEKMPSSSGDSVALYAGIKKKPMTVEITNLFPTAGKLNIPSGGTDNDGHSYESVDNRVIISGYEYGDSFSLPEDYDYCINAGMSQTVMDKTPYIGAVNATQSSYYSPFICYSTMGDLNISRVMTLDTVTEDYNSGKIFLNKKSTTSPSGSGVGKSVTLDKNTTQDGTLKLYAYFAEEVRASVADSSVDLVYGGSPVNWNYLNFTANGTGAVEFTGNTDEKDQQWWYCSATTNEISLKTWFQGNKPVTIPKFTLDNGSTSNDKEAILCTYGAGLGQRPYLNDGSTTINSNFSYYHDGIPAAIDICASKQDYVLLDLSSSGLDWTNSNVNSFGLANPYYIPEAGDTTNHKYKIALTSFTFENGNIVAGPGAAVPDRSVYYYDNPNSLGSSPTRYYVAVPDDAIYPWGLLGQARDLSSGLVGAVGTVHKNQDMYIGKSGRKLLGYTLTYLDDAQQSTDPPFEYHALYWSTSKGSALHISVPEDYTVLLYDASNTTTPVGTLLSLGNDDSRFLSHRIGQLVISPIFGPATSPFKVGFIYKYENGTNNPYLRISDISEEDLGFVSYIGLSTSNSSTKVEADVYQFGGTSGILNERFDDLSFNGEKYVSSQLWDTSGPSADYSMYGNMVKGTDGKYYQDIPIKYALASPTVGSGSGDQYFVRGFKKDFFNTPLTDPARILYEIRYQDANGRDYFLMTSNGGSVYAPCAVDVFVPENEFYRYTGIYDASNKLVFAFDEREYSFNSSDVSTYLAGQKARHGGMLSGVNSAMPGVYYYVCVKDDGTVEDSTMPISFTKATSGNAHTALHGSSDSYRYAGLLQFRDYKTAMIMNPDNVTCYEASAGDQLSGNALQFANSGVPLANTELNANVTQGRCKCYLVSPDENTLLNSAPEEYMLVQTTYGSTTDKKYWIRIDSDGQDPAAGDAVVAFSPDTN